MSSQDRNDPIGVWLDDWTTPPPAAPSGGEPPDAPMLVALLRAGIARDDQGVAALTAGVNIPGLAAAALGLASAFGEALYGSTAALDAALAQWQATGHLPAPGDHQPRGDYPP